MGVDYLQKYVTAEGLDFPRLLNDDFFLPIKLLYNHRHYASATKLLLSFIDTVGFIEFGETRNNVFTLWLDAYADLTPVGVTAAELWELRNSLLHMSNLNSRRVQAGHVKALISYVGQLPANIARETATAKYYSWNELLNAVARACERWLASYNADRSKFPTFVERYDLIISDARLMEIQLDSDA